MKLPAAESPDLTEASVRAQTGKTLAQWFAQLDEAGGLAQGRRDLVHAIYTPGKVEEWWAVTLVVEYERARGAKEKDGQPKGYSICSTKTIAAPRERVFQAFGRAEDLDRWLGPKTRVEFVEGGTLANGDGDRATITRIRPGKDLRLVWQHATRAPGSQVEVLFADKGADKTGLTLNHTRIQSRKDADELRAGWSTAFEQLKAHLEGA